WYNWNVYYWGTTFQYHINDQFTIKSGVLEQNPQAPDRGRHWSLSTDGSKGVVLPLELEWRPNTELPGIYNLALLYTNAKRDQLNRLQADGRPQSKRDTIYLYGSFNQQLTRHENDINRGLSLSYSFGLADQSVTASEFTQSVSLRYRGLFDSRPEDMLAAGISYVRMGGDYKEQQAAMNQVDISHSTVSELYYRIRATPWLDLQPSLQYWQNPGAMASTSDAWVIGFKTFVTF
ncbi:MAG: carbohydrate porin, partial [Enterobacteriaceae bacterium]